MNSGTPDSESSRCSASLAIIIPAYNAGRRIGATLESVLAQTWRNIQVWVVDDGSTDDTEYVVKAYINRDSRIRLLRQENSGPYLARLAALRMIDTDYFGFVDSDDTIEPDMYESMIDFAEENGLDVVRCDIHGESDGGVSEIMRGRDEIFRRFVAPKLIEGRGNALITDKIYRLKCRDAEFLTLKSISFEDVIMNMSLFRNVSSFGYVHKGFYHYYPNPCSTTRTIRDSDIDGIVEVLNVRKDMIKGLGGDPGSVSAMRWVVVNAYNMLRKISTSRGMDWQRKRRWLKRLLSIGEVKVAVGRCRGESDLLRKRISLKFAMGVPSLFWLYVEMVNAIYAVYGKVRAL